MSPKIAIIGAGTAGISCARTLLEYGFDVTIFEARDRIGGRIHVSNEFGKPVDLGPNWMHGDTKENSALSYFKDASVTLHDIGSYGTIFAPNGMQYSPDKVDYLEEFMWKYVEEAIEYSKENAATIDPELSLYDYVKRVAKDRYPDNAEMQEQILMATRIFGFYIGEDVKRQSLKFAFLEEPSPGENLFVASGFASILQNMAEKVIDKVDLHLNTPVVEIDTSVSGVNITLNSGQSIAFDAVVVAVPLGALKKRAIAFHPELPARLLSAVDSLGYGRLEKVYIRFPRKFWSLDYYEFFAPAYAPHTNPEKGPMSVISLAHLPEPYCQPVLLWYLYGELSQKVVNMQTDGEKIAFFEPYFSRIPGYEPGRDEPAAIISTSWSNDPYAGYGSYSCFTVGLKEGDIDIEELRRGLPERNLWFAGEHCSDVLQLATVGGAYGSGTHAGHLVVNHFESKN
ncbi:hypothetical protein V1517DRAFT_324047 [Lipomyces orientalis]|uniref:Uncharacterized protein n=1 Tax=Lipomyces orientalis TaxID=1233043 RepID=A0ACC3TMX3_9ASCO